jgi:RNA polymerase-binding transcription factor DksA
MTTRFSLTSHRRAALERLVSEWRDRDPARSIRAVEALRRMEAGSYGYCFGCGLRIPEASLETEPERRFCAGCGNPRSSSRRSKHRSAARGRTER